jgi:4-hydroxy-2-oxoglutarate aldolase
VNPLLQGVIPPLATPFDERGALDLEALERNVESYATTGFTGFLVLGSNGEAVCLTEAEKVAAIQAVVRRASDRTVYAGVGVESTYATIELTKKAAAAGAHAALVLNPLFFKGHLNGAALRRHYEAIADASPIPVLLYSMPAATGLALPPSVVHDLARHGNIQGMKDSSGDVANMQRLLCGVPGDFPVAAGSAPAFYPALCLGAAGGVLAVAQCAPQATCALYEAFRAGDHARARKIQMALTPLATAVTATYGVAGLKAAVTLTGRRGGVPRAPIAPATEAAVSDLRELIARANEAL